MKDVPAAAPLRPQPALRSLPPPAARPPRRSIVRNLLNEFDTMSPRTALLFGGIIASLVTWVLMYLGK
jgi:hypothetical protein